MKAILNFEIDVQLAHEEMSKWSKEHAGYYGKPHGVRQLKSGLYCGYSTKSNEQFVEYVNKTFSIDCQSYDHLGGWLSSGGNLTVIGIKDNKIEVFLDGVRHGLRFPFWYLKENSSWQYLETHMPADCHPYETRDDFASQSLDNLLRCKDLYAKDLYAYEYRLKSLNADNEAFASEYFVVDYYHSSLILDFDYEDLDYEIKILHDLKAHLHLRGWLPKYVNLAKQSVMKFTAASEENEASSLFLSMIVRHHQLKEIFKTIEFDD